MALRKYRTGAALAANQAEATRADASAFWVCLALLLAVVALAARIVSIW